MSASRDCGLSCHNATDSSLSSSVASGLSTAAMGAAALSSNLDGFAVRAEDTFGAAEETPRGLRLNPEELATGVVPRREVPTRDV